jgi:uncharacterized protein YbjT (DUF2867 family)
MILVAGGSGRLGTLVVRRFSARHLAVRVLTRDPARAAHLAGEHVELVVGDVRNRTSLDSAMTGVETVVSAVHGFAGPGGVSPTSIDRDGNANLVDAARAACADVVLLSIVGASAESPMELFRMKHAAEQHLLASGVPYTIVRSTAFLELWIDLMKETAGRSGRPLVFGRGGNPINFVSVADVALLVERVTVDRGTRGQTLEIGGPENLTFNQVATAVQAACGWHGLPRHVPRPVLRLIATVASRKSEIARKARASIAMDQSDLRFDPATLRGLYPDLPSQSLKDVLGRRCQSIPGSPRDEI